MKFVSWFDVNKVTYIRKTAYIEIEVKNWCYISSGKN